MALLVLKAAILNIGITWHATHTAVDFDGC